LAEEILTVAREASVEIVIKKSRFIGCAAPVGTEAEAAAFIERVRKEHWSATHNCSAYVVGERGEFRRSSDDGEPAGTAGRPMLDVILRRGLTNVVVVVTRYFGGVLLGAGGLVRAYSEAASRALDAAGVVREAWHEAWTVVMPYELYGRVEYELRRLTLPTGRPHFADRVSLDVYPPVEVADRVEWLLNEWCQGQAVIVRGGRRRLALPVEAD